MMHNVATAAGVGCVVYSAYLVTPTLAFFVGGAALIIVGLGGARLAAAKQREASKLNDR